MSNLITQDQVSAGGVVYRKEANITETVLIAVGTPRRWQLPKGLLRLDEDPEATALREVQEETGIIAQLRVPLEKIEYWYYGQSHGHRVRFHKVVHFFLLEFQSGNTENHDQEVEEARWVEIEQAEAMLTFKSEQKVMNQARMLLLNK